MKRLLLGGMALVAMALAGGAQAADAPAVPGPWDGFYAGVSGGGDWGDDLAAMIPTPPSAGGSILQQAAKGHIDADGVIAGGQVGFNRELPGLLPFANINGLFGFEADINYTDLSGSRTAAVPPPFSPGTIYEKFSSDWLATARVRLGTTFWSQFLLYGTGGLAVTDARFTGAANFHFNVDNPHVGFAGSQNEGLVGWTAGGGAEWMFLPGWSVKLEYLHVDFGTADFTSTSPNGILKGIIVVNRHKLTEDIARLGINYKFWGI
jgi:outer membrane immunogenic protein